MSKLEVEMGEGGRGKEKPGGMRRQAQKDKTCLGCQKPGFLFGLG